MVSAGGRAEEFTSDPGTTDVSLFGGEMVLVERRGCGSIDGVWFVDVALDWALPVAVALAGRCWV